MSEKLMTTEKRKLGLLRREMEFDLPADAEESRTVDLAFSSEAPVERSFGMEILDHSPASVRMDRLNNSAPLLLNHDPDKQIGVVEGARIDSDRIGRAKVRFGNSQLANEIFQDVKDGIRRLVSVGYRVHDFVEDKASKAGEAFRAIPWEPMEISIVSVPADVSVGVGRGDTEQTETVFHRMAEPEKTNKPNMSENTTPAPIKEAGPNIEVIREEANRKAGADAITRYTEMQDIAEKASRFIKDAKERAHAAFSAGKSLNEFQRELFDAFPKADAIGQGGAEIGMSQKEVQRYSIARAIMGMASGKLEGIEKEAHEAAAKRQHEFAASGRNFVVPYDVLSKRDQLVGTASLGGNLKATNLLAGEYIDILRNQLVLAEAGARYMPGLVGDIAIPKRLVGSTVYHVTEAQATTESTGTFGQVTMTPKAASAFVQYGMKLLVQSTPSIDQLVQDDIIQQISVDMESKILHGSGSAGQPTGLAGESGIGSVAGGTDGAAPDWTDIVGLETAVAIDNANVGSLSYLTNTSARGKLKQTPMQGSGVEGNFIWKNGDTLNGYTARVTNNVSAVLTKGTSTTVCSALFYGNWSDLVIGTWGGMEVIVDPYSAAANRLVGVHAHQYYDKAVRRAESFSAMLDALTA